MLQKNQGFTLIEVMIVVAIVGILAAIAYPSYDEYIKRGYRAEGQALLNDAAARQERYYAQNYKYTTDVSKLYGSTPGTSETKKYELKIEQKDGDGGYTLTGLNQFNDKKCGDLSLDATGVRATSLAVADVCWR